MVKQHAQSLTATISAIYLLASGRHNSNCYVVCPLEAQIKGTDMSRRRDNAVEGVDISIGQRLRSRRLELGISQTGLADAMGVTFQQVQKYEKGTNRISPSRLMMASSLLGVPPHSFFETPTPKDVELNDQSIQEITEFLSNKQALALAVAFAKIKSAAMRRDIANLVAEIAGNAAGKAG